MAVNVDLRRLAPTAGSDRSTQPFSSVKARRRRARQSRLRAKEIILQITGITDAELELAIAAIINIVMDGNAVIEANRADGEVQA